MSYRNPLAQAIHSALMKHIWDFNESSLDAFKIALTKADVDSLKETSLSGHSHLMDIFNLPLSILGDKGKAIQLTGQLFQVFMEFAPHPEAKAFLLVQGCIEDFTPLHHVLALKNVKNLEEYFKAVRQAFYTDKLLDKETFGRLWIRPNKAGFNPLHAVLMAGNTENLRLYLGAVNEALNEKLISEEEYNHLLVSQNGKGFTPLHEALIASNVDNMRIYFSAVRRAHEKHELPDQEYLRLLVNANHAGFTPLISALESNIDNLRIYFTEIQEQKGKLIPLGDYKCLLIQPTRSGLTPLAQVLKSGSLENFRYYFEAVHQARQEDLISEQEYAHLLIGENHVGFTPLHQAAFGGNYELLTLFVHTLEKNLPPEEMMRLFNATTQSNHLPSCPSRKPDAIKINKFMSDKRTSLNQSIKGKLSAASDPEAGRVSPSAHGQKNGLSGSSETIYQKPRLFSQPNLNPPSEAQVSSGGPSVLNRK